MDWIMGYSGGILCGIFIGFLVYDHVNKTKLRILNEVRNDYDNVLIELRRMIANVK